MKTFTAEERKNFIVSHVKENEFVDISYLKNALKVSEMTIRRDLKKLEDDNALVRVLGGARCMPNGAFEAPVDKRVKVHSTEKDKVARYAASLIREGDSIFMDASSTIYAMVPYLDTEMTVITNNISICTRLKDNEKIKVILLGGSLRRSAMSLVGQETIHMIGHYFVDKAFLSSKAVDDEYGIYDATADEAEVKKAMMESSGETFFLMDHYKLKSRAFYKVCDIEDAAGLIVDRVQDEFVQDFISACQKKKYNIHCVD
ncbi:MAG TPA: DeoR/GlpR family DNA-binding transcription regulator [Candidatus Mediterraneibacter excrementipullorum]|nr:DeoR/GlpR family DNA-binding transcription regulator [Candidatus Mediterraneibacter excrementipullorum]